jgi:hypothetical protein
VVLPRWLRELPLQQPQLNSLVALGLQNALNLRELSTERCTISTRMTKSSSTASFLPQHASAMYTPASLLPGPFPAAGANTRREYSRCKFYRVSLLSCGVRGLLIRCPAILHPRVGAE